MRLWPLLYYSRIIRLDELGQTFCSSYGYASQGKIKKRVNESFYVLKIISLFFRKL